MIPLFQAREKERHTHKFWLIHMLRHKPFQPMITLRHPGPPSDINISVIKPTGTPAFS